MPEVEADFVRIFDEDHELYERIFLGTDTEQPLF